jgi:hypothetical protein
MDEWSYKRDLEFDLLATNCRRRGQACNKIKRARELLYSFDQSGTGE